MLETVGTDVDGNGPVDSYGFAEQRLQQVVESENILADTAAELSNGSFQNVVNFVQEHLPASVEEPVGELRKQTYAAILRVAKGQPAASVAPQHLVNKSVPPGTADEGFYPRRRRMLVFAMHLLNSKKFLVFTMPSSLVVFILLDNNYSLKSGDQTATSHLEWEEEGVEEGAATNQRGFWLSKFWEGWRIQ